jgi:hypothetical protein
MTEKLIDFRNIPPPPLAEMLKRDELIEKLKQQLGHKYLLSKPIPRVQ